mmetsp:Transcript_9214/g.19984  ORF Transcript_9214/g.19984 Transcript_9214/m.19984 type:complete len:107 (-) Transcript_9214:750-1070(-)
MTEKHFLAFRSGYHHDDEGDLEEDDALQEDSGLEENDASRRTAVSRGTATSRKMATSRRRRPDLPSSSGSFLTQFIPEFPPVRGGRTCTMHNTGILLLQCPVPEGV